MNKIEVHPEKESKSLEFKAKLPNFQSLTKTCIAFANGSGGRIIIGVEDNTRRIIGIAEDDRDRIYNSFPNSLYDSTSPNIFAQIYENNFNGILILTINIPPSPKKPYFLKSEGIPKGVYLRVGSSTRTASKEYVEDLIREGQRISFDEEPINQNIAILSKNLLKDFYETKVTNTRLLADKLITHAIANNDHYLPTIAGTIIFCETPESFIPESIIICSRFAGTTGRNIIQTEEITGNFEKQAQTSFKIVTSWLLRDYQLNKTKLKGKLPIPQEALREAIINALIHRKYSIPGATKIALYDDRLEIFSPGCFPGLVDINNLGDGTTYLRNPTIARIAHKMGLVEKLGSGIRLIFDSCRKLHLKKPIYSEEGDFVKITFYFQQEKNIEKSDEDNILELAKIRQEITIGDIINQLSISRNTVTRKINILIKQNKIARIGKGPATKFKACSQTQGI
jgi:ATP-dependent DNA helicase RecG